jgi:hypothetical protein
MFQKKYLIICAIALLLLAVAFSVKYFFFTSSENNQTENVYNTNSVSSNVNKILVSSNKPDPIWNDKVSKDFELQKKADSFLYLLDKMPQVPVFLKDEPILKNGTNTEKGLAYTICESDKPTIFIKKDFYQQKNIKQLDNVLKHELVHAYFCRQGVQVGHDKLWRDKFTSIGGFGN